MDKPLLIIIARNPRLGAVKTRLAKHLGHNKTLFAYQRMFNAVLRQVARDPRWRTIIALDTLPHTRPCFQNANLTKQGSGELGTRLSRLARRAKTQRLIFIGTDCPDIQRSHIAHAFKKLINHDAVIGPADDGGYWLIGLRRFPFLNPFQNIRWSGTHTFADTLARLPHRRIAFLQTLADIDTIQDYKNYKQTRRANNQNFTFL